MNANVLTVICMHFELESEKRKSPNIVVCLSSWTYCSALVATGRQFCDVPKSSLEEEGNGPVGPLRRRISEYGNANIPTLRSRRTQRRTRNTHSNIQSPAD